MLPVRGLPPIQFFLLAVGILSMVALSNSLLYQVGWDLGSPGAPMPLKIHPASYIVTMAFGIMVFLRWRIFDLRVIRADLPKALRTYILCWTLIFIYVLLYMGGGSIGFMVDSLLAPFFTLGLLVLCTDRQRARIFTMLVVFVCINGLIGIMEKSIGTNLIPLVIEGITVRGGGRATALMGHPLYNGLITVMMALAVMGLKPPMRKQRTRLLMVFFLLLFASLAFGARAATAALVIFSVVYAASSFAKSAASKQINYASLALATVMVMVVPLVFTSLLLFTDVGNALFDRLKVDDSALTRLQLFRIYEHMTFKDFMLGVDNDNLERLMNFVGLPWTVENSWIMLHLRFGTVFFIVFLIGFFSLLAFLWKNTNLAGKMAIGMMLINVTTNNMLAAKGHTLTVVCVIAYTAPAWLRYVSRGYKPRRASPGHTSGYGYGYGYNAGSSRYA